LQKERGFYVEGYAMSHEDWPFQHAWITLDGLHAVDVTLRSPASDCFYFGISIPFRILRAEILARDGRFPVPPVGSRISDGKNGGRASKGDCRSAGLRPYVEPVVTPSIM